MRVQLADITKSYGAQVVLDRVTLTVGPRARIGLVGPNGVGKSTLLRLFAGVGVARRRRRQSCSRDADGRLSRAGAARRAWARSIIATLGRRAGVLGAERELEDAAGALARGEVAEERYSPRARALPGARRRRLRGAGANACAPTLASTSTSNARATASPAERRPVSRSRRSCSLASTCSCSTSRRTTSTSTVSSDWSASSSRYARRARARVATTASSSTAR